MKTKIIALLIFITILGQHFQLASIGGFPLTVGLFSGTAAIIILTQRFPYAPITVVWAIIICFSGTAALLSGNVSGEQYFRTLLLFLFCSAVVTVGATSSDATRFTEEPIKNSFFLALVTLVALSVTQTITGSLGSEIFFNIFGPYQYLYQYNPYLEFNALPRAQGLFLEPSYNSFVIGTLGTILLCLRKNIALTFVLVGAGFFVTQSATGLSIFAFLLVVGAVRSGLSKFFVVVSMACVAIISVGPYLAQRFASIFIVSSSANYRIIAPLEVLAEVLSENPLGQPLGSIEEVLAGYDLSNGNTLGTSLDNGFYVVVYYFGWIGLFALFVSSIAVCLIVGKKHNSRSSLSWIAPLWLFGSLAFSGGIMLPEFGLMSSFVIIAFISSYNIRKSQNYVPIKHPNSIGNSSYI